MRCFHPRPVLWYKSEVAPEDRWEIQKPVFVSLDRSRFIHRLLVKADGKLDLMYLPCGKCGFCRLKRAGEWTARNLMEVKEHTHACFVTLTCDDVHLSKVFPGGSLCYRPFQIFMKSLRQSIKVPVRFMMCGEYGADFKRPHFHFLLYGFDFPDRYLATFRDGRPYYRSPLLESLWPHGFSLVSCLSFQSISYVCRYVLKKLPSNDDYAASGLMPEFVHMSLKPGIGYDWFVRHGFEDTYARGLDGSFPNDFVYLGDFKIRPPRYFDNLLQRVHNADYVSLKAQRQKTAALLPEVSKSDLVEAERYLNFVTQGRIKKGDFNV